MVACSELKSAGKHQNGVERMLWIDTYCPLHVIVLYYISRVI